MSIFDAYGLMLMTSSWLPAATLVVGIVGTLGGQLLSGLLTEEREHRARIAEREVARDAFQRETLIELQDALLSLLRNTYQINVHHQRIFGDTGQFARAAIPDDLDESNRVAGAAVSRLKQRVLDDNLRQSVRDIQDFCAKVTTPYLDYLLDSSLTDEQRAGQARKELRELAERASALEDQLGKRLREVL